MVGRRRIGCLHIRAICVAALVCCAVEAGPFGSAASGQSTAPAWQPAPWQPSPIPSPAPLASSQSAASAGQAAPWQPAPRMAMSSPMSPDAFVVTDRPSTSYDPAQRRQSLYPPEAVPPSVQPYDDLRESTTVYAAPYDANCYTEWTPQLLPNGLIYRAYLGDQKASRMATVFSYQEDFGWLWDITLGGQVGLFRYGSTDEVRPEGFQIDIEGSAQPRLDMENEQDMIAADFRAGLPITYGIGRWQTKFAFYHLSSHLGDEFAIKNPGFRRINYSRDALVLGQSYYVTDALRVYGEAGWAYYSDVSDPWEFQFGVDYSPVVFNGLRGSPYFSLNGQLRQEVNFSGNVVAQAGWQWRGAGRGQLLRIGAQYYNGKSSQFQLYDQNENRVGMGIWYDF